MTTPIVEINNLGFAYDGQPVLESVNLTVRRGDFLAVLGPNGGGKTTLLKLMLGLLRPRSGQIRVFGQAPELVSDRIGYVPQHVNVSSGFPVRTIDAVLMGLTGPGRIGWKYTKRERALASEALSRVQLAGAENLQLDTLSGGQKQRALIARALISDPELLLLDEPTANVDPQGKFCLYELLTMLCREKTIVVVSHDLSILSSRVNSVACVNRKLARAPEPKLSSEMLTLLYGSHDHTCDMADFIEGIPPQIDLIQRSR